MCDDAESSPGHVSESGDDSDDSMGGMGSMGSDSTRYDLNDGFVVPDSESDEEDMCEEGDDEAERSNGTRRRGGRIWVGPALRVHRGPPHNTRQDHNTHKKCSKSDFGECQRG